MLSNKHGDLSIFPIIPLETHRGETLLTFQQTGGHREHAVAFVSSYRLPHLIAAIWRTERARDTLSSLISLLSAFCQHETGVCVQLIVFLRLEDFHLPKSDSLFTFLCLPGSYCMWATNESADCGWWKQPESTGFESAVLKGLGPLCAYWAWEVRRRWYLEFIVRNTKQTEF